jgi:murein DD-endopeptidase MepM/ murein hydrolase activator NlpD
MALSSLTAAGVLTLGLSALPMASVAAIATSPPVGWRWPLAGTPVVSRPFQRPLHPWSAGHRGVDLAAPPDATVLAAGGGVVSFAGYVAGVGVVAVLHPGGLRTTYEPVAPTVAAGAAVSAGDPLGRLLPGHGDCGPGRWCLHWGLLRGAVYLDPLTLVRRGPVRLLPLNDAAAGAGVGSPALPVQALAAPELPAASRRGHPPAVGRTPPVEVPATAGARPSALTAAAAATAVSVAVIGGLARWLTQRVRPSPGRPGPLGPRRPVSPAGRRAWP